MFSIRLPHVYYLYFPLTPDPRPVYVVIIGLRCHSYHYKNIEEVTVKHVVLVSYLVVGITAMVFVYLLKMSILKIRIQ